MKKQIFYHALSALFVGGFALSALSCAEDTMDNSTSDGDKEAIVRFDVSDAQDEALSNAPALTRGLLTSGLTDADLADRVLPIESNDNLDACVVESTIEGVNPTKADAATRANIINIQSLGEFSSAGMRGESDDKIQESWFSNELTKSDGQLVKRIPWSWEKRHGIFYAVYPKVDDHKQNIKITAPTSNTAPTVDFTVYQDVKKQVDLMTACTGKVLYAKRHQAPSTSLNFRHALTAIRFAVGPNLSFNKSIRYISIHKALLRGTYKMSNDLNGEGTWVAGSLKEPGTVTLSGLNYSTTEYPNSIIRDTQLGNDKYKNETDVKKIEDNYTFYMIPQELDNKDVELEVAFTDNTYIKVKLAGKWKAGTTRTYKISQKQSNWDYKLDCTPSVEVPYNGTEATIRVKSYRKVANNPSQSVAWKVVGYDANGDGTYTMTEKPAWLKGFTKDNGTGGEADEVIKANLATDVVDYLAERNRGLQNATPVGSSTQPYNLSNSNGAANVENTANCYVISGPGYYMIPLVYGNAIKNGATNEDAYKSKAPSYSPTFGSPARATDIVLRGMRDHDGSVINSPWIEETGNRKNNGVNGAQVVWADEANLVKQGSLSIVRFGGKAYVKFEVTRADIKSGNAVVAVKKGNTIVWSWHLWFAPKNVLDKITVTNNQGKQYHFTNETLGWKPTKWMATPYEDQRTVKVKVEQTVGNNGVKQESIIEIKQNAYIERAGIATMYQWGRTEAMPGTDAIREGSFNKNGNDQIHIANKIQFPNVFFRTFLDNRGMIKQGDGLTKYHYFYNLWSIHNNLRGDENAPNTVPVTKSVYDPCPVGFSVPTNGAFSGFTANGRNRGTMNVKGTNNAATFNANMGHLFWTNSAKNATIYFPALGYRSSLNGNIEHAAMYGDYWSADPKDWNNACCMGFDVNDVYPLYVNMRTYAYPVRPVSE